MDSYFEKCYDSIRYPMDGVERKGLRNAQIGAIHAVASHFTIRRKEPAIVVMPTGSGKTAVLMMSAFVGRARRVLVVTPSRLVRSQIAEDFRNLAILKKIGVLGDAISEPKVTEVKGRVSSSEEWEELRSCDVVVGSPNSISPALEDVSEPPEDLFDLVLIDEAHHSPAVTWNKLMLAFPKAKRVLFTATPFRRDRQEIEGRLVYSYPIKAVRQGNAGQVSGTGSHYL